MFYVYILRSLKTDRFYVGQTKNLKTRVNHHNSGSVRSTKPFRPWKLVYFKEYEARSEAILEESRIKKWKNSKDIQWLIESRSQGVPSANGM